MNEATLSDITKKVLSKYFYIYTERKSKCLKGRIDLVLICKRTGVKFGVELKSTERKTGEQVGEIVKQCIRYTAYDFMVDDGEFNANAKFEKLPIFLCPALSNNIFAWVKERVIIKDVEYIIDRHEQNFEHHGINGFLGAFKIGEIRTFICIDYKTKEAKKYIMFIMSNQIIWSSRIDYTTREYKGLHQNNYDALIKKISK